MSNRVTPLVVAAGLIFSFTLTANVISYSAEPSITSNGWKCSAKVYLMLISMAVKTARIRLTGFRRGDSYPVTFKRG